MEQLASCMEVSVEKYNELVAEIKKQTEIEEVTQKHISEVDNKIVIHTWMERGFFIFTGFLSGGIIGLVTTIIVIRCTRKSSRQASRNMDVEMIDMKTRSNFGSRQKFQTQSMEVGVDADVEMKPRSDYEKSGSVEN